VVDRVRQVGRLLGRACTRTRPGEAKLARLARHDALLAHEVLLPGSAAACGLGRLEDAPARWDLRAHRGAAQLSQQLGELRLARQLA
jgi:hypothetical protein